MTNDTPCIGVCFIDPKAKLCLGCGRTLHEIAHWNGMNSSARRAIMATLHQRMLDAGLPLPPPKAERSAGT